MALADSTTPSDALKAAKQLVGSYAHLRPDNPETFLASIGAVLAQYPLGLVREVVDPRTGIARKAEFLSVAALVAWCDDRLSHLTMLANYEARPPKPPERVFTDEERAAGREFLAKLAAELKGGTVAAALAPDVDRPCDSEAAE